uniref:Uncharacterized protein n=1 Tax=Sinocyclocheilus rhinocerous TaxID=307959 RepID=A0A673GNA1_9TELE
NPCQNHLSIYPEVVWINVEFVAVQLAELRVSAFDAIQVLHGFVSKGTEIPLKLHLDNFNGDFFNISIFLHPQIPDFQIVVSQSNIVLS